MKSAIGFPIPGSAAAPDIKNLLTAQRRERIAELITRDGAARVNDLSRLFAVSEVTIRADLDAMAKSGLLVRDHGGAIANAHTSLAVAFEQRALHRREVKRRIGAAAAQLVRPGDTIIVDAGTTAMAMAKALTVAGPLTVVTNALNVAAEIGSRPEVNIILAGGSLSRETISTLGSIAERTIAGLIVDKLFLGAHAIDAQKGVVDVSVEGARVKAAMIQAARRVYLMADSSKWERTALALVAPLSEIHTLICDDGLPAYAREALASHNVELIEVPGAIREPIYESEA